MSRKVFIEAIEQSYTRLISSASFLEASIVILQRYGDEGLRDLDHFIAKAELEIKPVDSNQAHLARLAYRKFGKSRHPANLNFGDCCAYAVSKSTGQPLLFKGNDFSKTDIDEFEIV